MLGLKTLLSWMRREPVWSPSPLNQELLNLRVNISRSQRRMGDLSEEFDRRGMYCCPCCAFPEYSDLKLKQERRELRIRQLETKIKKDSRHVERTPALSH